MNLNRDEFLLLSRTGRGPHSTRAGPGPDEVFEAGLDRSPHPSPRSQRTDPPQATVWDGGCATCSAPAAGARARASRTLEPIDHEYLELEFAVGFPARGRDAVVIVRAARGGAALCPFCEHLRR